MLQFVLFFFPSLFIYQALISVLGQRHELMPFLIFAFMLFIISSGLAIHSRVHVEYMFIAGLFLFVPITTIAAFMALYLVLILFAGPPWIYLGAIGILILLISYIALAGSRKWAEKRWSLEKWNLVSMSSCITATATLLFAGFSTHPERWLRIVFLLVLFVTAAAALIIRDNAESMRRYYLTAQSAQFLSIAIILTGIYILNK